MTLLTAADIIGVRDLEVLDIEVKAWGGTVRVRKMDAQQAVDLLPVFQDSETNQIDRIVMILANCIIDADGVLLFKDNPAVLKNKSPQVLIKLFEQVAQFLGVGTASGNDAKKN